MRGCMPQFFIHVTSIHLYNFHVCQSLMISTPSQTSDLSPSYRGSNVYIWKTLGASKLSRFTMGVLLWVYSLHWVHVGSNLVFLKQTLYAVKGWHRVCWGREVIVNGIIKINAPCIYGDRVITVNLLSRANVIYDKKPKPVHIPINL